MIFKTKQNKKGPLSHCYCIVDSKAICSPVMEQFPLISSPSAALLPPALECF